MKHDLKYQLNNLKTYAGMNFLLIHKAVFVLFFKSEVKASLKDSLTPAYTSSDLSCIEVYTHYFLVSATSGMECCFLPFINAGILVLAHIKSHMSSKQIHW